MGKCQVFTLRLCRRTDGWTMVKQYAPLIFRYGEKMLVASIFSFFPQCFLSYQGQKSSFEVHVNLTFSLQLLSAFSPFPTMFSFPSRTNHHLNSTFSLQLLPAFSPFLTMFSFPSRTKIII